MKVKRNNLFEFVSEKLNQDAFVCWCINWINYKDIVKGDKNKEKLCELANRILDKILENSNIKSFNVKHIKILRKFKDINIILIITTKSLKQYAVIIDDRRKINFNNYQRQGKFINIFKNSKEINSMLYLENFDKNNVITVFWKNNIWRKEELGLKELSKNSKEKLIYINGNDTLELLKDYVEYSEIVENFYNYLYEHLRLNNQMSEDKYSVDKIIETRKISEGTIFSKKYYVYNCFCKLLQNESNNKKYYKKDEIVLDEISKKIINRKILNKSRKLEKKDNKKILLQSDIVNF